jgi:hypothetical protein
MWHTLGDGTAGVVVREGLTTDQVWILRWHLHSVGTHGLAVLPAARAGTHTLLLTLDLQHLTHLVLLAVVLARRRSYKTNTNRLCCLKLQNTQVIGKRFEPIVSFRSRHVYINLNQGHCIVLYI